MAQFVLVVNGVSNVAFEKALAIANNPESKIVFTPQPAQSSGVSSAGLVSLPAQPAPGASYALMGVRFEWSTSELAIQLVNALAGH